MHSHSTHQNLHWFLLSSALDSKEVFPQSGGQARAPEATEDPYVPPWFVSGNQWYVVWLSSPMTFLWIKADNLVSLGWQQHSTRPHIFSFPSVKHNSQSLKAVMCEKTKVQNFQRTFIPFLSLSQDGWSFTSHSNCISSLHPEWTLITKWNKSDGEG